MCEKPNIWSHLAQSLVMLGNHESAYEVLKTAAAVEDQDWRLWRDLLLISSYCEKYETVIKAYNSILDLKGCYIDEKPLAKVTHAVLRSIECGDVKIDPTVKPELCRLFCRLSTCKKMTSGLWTLFGLATACEKNPSEEVQSVVAQRLKMASTLATEDPFWYKNKENALNVLQVTGGLAEAYTSCARLFGKTRETIKMLKAATDYIGSVLQKMCDHNSDILSNEVKPIYKPLVESIDFQLMHIERLQDLFGNT